MTISVGNLIVAGGATVDTSEVLSALNKQGLKVWVGTTSQRDALPENVKNDDKITFLTYDSEEDIYLIIDTIISYSKTWSSVKISTELAKKINSSDVYTKTEVMSLINSKVASALKYRGAVATVAALPSSGQENGDSYYVQADGYMYAWSSDYSDWQALGSATDMTNYYTKSEVDALLADMAVKFQYSVMPTADSTTVGRIIQYTGADTQDYKNGYWYKGVDNGDSTYSWAQDTAYIPTKMTIDNCQKVIGKTSFSGNEIVDVNDLQESGVYSVWTSANASNLPRYDYATWWEISVITKSNLHSHYCHQIAIGANDLVYVRQCDNAVWSSWQKLATTDSIYKTVSTGSLTSAGGNHWFIVDNLYPLAGLQTATYVINGRNGGCYIMSCGTTDDANKLAPTITTISSGSNPLVGFNYDLTTGKVELQSNQYNTLFITQISGVRNDFTIENETNTPQLSTAGVMETMATTDDIFLVGDRRNTIGWADLSNSVDIDGSSNYANNIGRIEGHNAIIEVSNPTIGYQWPVTNSGDSNKFMDFGGAIQFFVDKVNNHLYVRFADSVDMSNWGEIATKSDLSYKYATSVTNKQYTFNFNTPGISILEIIATGYSDVRVAGHWIVNCAGTFGPSCQVISDNSSSSIQSCTFSVTDTVLNMSFAEEPYNVLVKELTRA